MKRVRPNNLMRKALWGDSPGLTLIEVVIAIALIGLIGAAVLSALSTASLALIRADQRATSESLARTQMEYIKDNSATPYDGNLTPPHPLYSSLAPSILPLPPNYSVNTTAVRLDQDEPPNTDDDDGLQQITVNVTYKVVGADNIMRERQYVLVDYKRNPET